MSANPGNSLKALRTTPPERGSFPLDHFGDCKDEMTKYMKCLKLVGNENAPNCRLLAKSYLRCRMDNELMDRVDWRDLGLPTDEEEKQQQNN
jgi:cytochrome c oxidase assembly protein subunit 19